MNVIPGARRAITQPGIGGLLMRPEDFVVEEIISRGVLQKYQRTARGVVRMSGPYALLKLTKRNCTTDAAIRTLSLKYNRPVGDFGVAGRKDRHAVTTQYLTLKSNDNPQSFSYTDDILSVEHIGRSPRPLQHGDLTGNNFTITLHECTNLTQLPKLLNRIRRGIPNYFGPQRFGSNLNNHEIGKFLLQHRFSDALALVQEHHPVRDLHAVPRERLKLYLQAYQSFLFNTMLTELLATKKVPHTLPLAGLTTQPSSAVGYRILRQLLGRDKLTPQDFHIDTLHVACHGTQRPAMLIPHMEPPQISSSCVRLRFMLPAGSYATTVLHELQG